MRTPVNPDVPPYRRIYPRLSAQGFEEPDLTGFETSDSEGEEGEQEDSGFAPPEPEPQLVPGFGDNEFSADDHLLSFSILPPPKVHLAVPYGQRKEGEGAARSGPSYAAVLLGSRSVGGGGGGGIAHSLGEVGGVPTPIDVATAVTGVCCGIGSTATPGGESHAGGRVSGVAAAADDGVNTTVHGEDQEERLSLPADSPEPSRTASFGSHARDSSEDSGFGPPFGMAVVDDCCGVLGAVDASSPPPAAAAAAAAAGGQHGSGIVNTIARSFAVFSPTRRRASSAAAAAATAATTRASDEADRVAAAPAEESGAAVVVADDGGREADRAVGAQENIDKTVESDGALSPPADVERGNLAERGVPQTRGVMDGGLERGGVAVEGCGTREDGVGAGESGGSAAAAAVAVDSSDMEGSQSTSLTPPRRTHRAGSVDTTTSEVRR